MEHKSMRDMIKLNLGEEITNCVSHGIMAILILCLLAPIAVYSYLKAGALHMSGIVICLICLFIMFLSSTLYHCMPFGSNHKYVFRKIDHICIFLAIAGTYTPVAISLIGGWQAIVVLCIEWGAVLFGILLKSIATKSYPKLSMAIYMAMGWAAIMFMPVLLSKASLEFLIYIVLGGIMYTIGAIFYARKKPYMHAIWHICINIASILQIIAVVFYI
jgi:hemolysin III